MTIQIELPDDDFKYFNELAKHELRKIIVQYFQEIVREANRLEGNIRTTEGNSETEHFI